MTVVFVRHGKADYSLADQRKLPSIEKDFCPLSQEGKQQAKAAQSDPSFSAAQIIVSSPYTRALQTAEIINRSLELDISVEFDLHEWKADLAGGLIDRWERDRRWTEYMRRHGEYPSGEERPWETYTSVYSRVRKVLTGYVNYGKIIAVCHGTVITSQCGWNTGLIPFAGSIICEYDQNFNE